MLVVGVPMIAAQLNARPVPAQSGLLLQFTHAACTLFLTQETSPV